MPRCRGRAFLAACALGVLPGIASSLIAPAPLSAQATGSIHGTVVDRDTDAPLAGVLVRLQRTGRGTLTDEQGRFILAGVAAGAHALGFELLGYQSLILQDAFVPAGERVRIDVALVPSAIEVEPLVVTADEVPLIEPQVPQTREVLRAPVLRALPITDVSEAIELTTGVSDGHFRGGRIGQETYVVDGLAIKNQLEASTEGPALEFSPTSLQEVEVTTGGFGAEYGAALSGVVSYVTRRGNPEGWEGAATVLTDQWAPEEWFRGFTGVSVRGGGPVSFLGRGTTLYADVLAQGMLDADPRARGLTCLGPEDADPALAAEIRAFAADPATRSLLCPFTREAFPHQRGDKLIGFLRLDRPLGENASLTATVLRNRAQNQLYTPEFKYNRNFQLGQRTTGTLATLAFDWTSQRAGRAFHLTARAAGMRLDRYLGVLATAALEDRFTVAGFGPSKFDFLGEEFVRRPLEEQLESVSAVPGYRPPVAGAGSPFGAAAEGLFVTGGTPGIANWSRSDFVGADIVAELLMTSGTALRGGGSARLYRVENYERARAFLAGSAPSYARFYPATVGGFLEAKVRPDELFAFDVGLRVEGFRSGLDFRRNRSNFLAPVLSTDWEVALMPRVGISGELENSAGRSAFRFNYARIAQPPDFQFFLDNTIGDSLRTDIRRQGNPALGFEQGRMFEFGLDHLFVDDAGDAVMGVGLVAFRKKLTNLVTGNIRFSEVGPGTFTTGDHGTVNGLELTARALLGMVEIRAGYALQEATGVASEVFGDTASVSPDRTVEFPLSFDRRHSLDLTLLAGRSAGDEDSPWGGALTATVQSGYPLAREIGPVAPPGEDPPDGGGPVASGDPTFDFERLPWTAQVDLRLSREIGSLPGCSSCRLRVMFDGRNILGLDNVIALRRGSGELAPSLERVREAEGRILLPGQPIPRESPDYAPLADLDGDGRITPDEFRAARFGAVLDRNDPSILFGEARQLRLGLEVTF